MVTLRGGWERGRERGREREVRNGGAQRHSEWWMSEAIARKEEDEKNESRERGHSTKALTHATKQTQADQHPQTDCQPNHTTDRLTRRHRHKHHALSPPTLVS